MSTLRLGYQQLRCVRQLPKTQLQQRQLALGSSSQAPRRNLTTDTTSHRTPGSEAFGRLAAEGKEGEWTKFSPEVIAASGIRPQPVKPFDGVNYARAVPTTPSYFTRQPYFNDALIKITKLFQKYEHLPVAPPERVQPQMWKNINEYKAACGEPLKGLPFSKLMGMVKRLHTIEPEAMPQEVTDALLEFKKGIDAHLNVAKPLHIDKYGRAVGTGRRKTSTARAWVVEGTGEVQVNGKPLSEAFGRVHDRESAIWALHSTERTDKYNVWALVEGGGTTGQAEALTLAIAKALLAHEPGLKPALRQGTSKSSHPSRHVMRSAKTTCRTRTLLTRFPNLQLAASRATRERWRGRNTATSRLARCPPGTGVEGGITRLASGRIVVIGPRSGRFISVQPSRVNLVVNGDDIPATCQDPRVCFKKMRRAPGSSGFQYYP